MVMVWCFMEKSEEMKQTPRVYFIYFQRVLTLYEEVNSY